MQHSLESLYRDHDNLRRVLFLVEQLLVDLHRNSLTELSLLRRCLSYIMDYPELAHHPAEDALFSILFKKGINDEKLEKNIRSLMKDHSDIEVITRKAVETIDSAITGKEANLQEIGERLSELIHRQRKHILYEELNIYPGIARLLDEDDWKQVEALVPSKDDPVFSENTRKEYEQLFRSL